MIKVAEKEFKTLEDIKDSTEQKFIQCYCDPDEAKGMSNIKWAKLYGVNRMTIGRWIEKYKDVIDAIIEQNIKDCGRLYHIHAKKSFDLFLEVVQNKKAKDADRISAAREIADRTMPKTVKNELSGLIEHKTSSLAEALKEDGNTSVTKTG